MSTYEHNTLMRYKDQNGDMHLTYPVTKAENVDGLYGDAALTGVPTAPTASSGTNTTQIATTAFVHQELEEVKATIPGEPDLTAYAKTSDLASVATSGSYNDLTDKPTIPGEPDLTAYAPLESPALTGTPIAPTAAFGTNTSQVATTAFVQRELTEVKKSVSDGKTAVANAITAKGVSTATDATFDIMAANIALIESGDESSALSLNVFTQETEPETKLGVWIQTPHQHEQVIVGKNNTYNIKYVYTGEWESKSTLPISNAYNFAAAAYNDKLYMIGDGGYGSITASYAFDGTSWSKTTNSPSMITDGAFAVVHNDKLYLLGGVSNTQKVKVFDGTTWSQFKYIIPYSFCNGCAVSYNGELHVMGGSSTSLGIKHYTTDGSGNNTFVKLADLPYALCSGCAVVYNDEIHILGSSVAPYNQHYAFNGNTWRQVSTLPYNFLRGSAVVYDGEIHILGGYTSPYTQHYKYDGNTWSEVDTLPYAFYDGVAVIYENKINLVGGYRNKYHYASTITASLDPNVFGKYVHIYQDPSSDNGTYATDFISGLTVSGENNKFPSGFDDIFYTDESNNLEASPTYYGDGTQWIKFKN